MAAVERQCAMRTRHAGFIGSRSRVQLRMLP